MTVPRILSVVAACLVVLAGAGCGERDPSQLIAETDEPLYVQGKQLMKQGRSPEALSVFLKVIDRRGERGAAESHLEAGQIYLNVTRDPVEAYHHFRRYLDLQPNSKEAERVKGMVKAAQREFAKTLPTRPLEDQSLKLQAEESLARLQRENEELRAQIATLRGGGATPLGGRAAPMISIPEEVGPRTAPPPVTPVVESTGTVRPTLRETAPVAVTSPTPAPSSRASAPATPTVTKPATQVRPPPASAATPAARGGRTYTVKQSDGLYAIARQADPANPSKKMKEIIEANPDVLNRGANTPLKPGMVLRIP